MGLLCCNVAHDHFEGGYKDNITVYSLYPNLTGNFFVYIYIRNFILQFLITFII